MTDVVDTGATAAPAGEATAAPVTETAAAPTTETPAVDPRERGPSLLSAEPEAKSAEGEKPADAPKEGEPEKKAEEAAKAEPLKPEDYKFELPENIAAEDPALKAFTEGAAELGISQEAAQALINKVAPQMQEAALEPYRQWAQLQEKWLGEVKADPEIGGSKLEGALATIASAFNTLGDNGGKDVRAALDMTGAGNHPAVIKFMHKVAVALTEAGAVTGSPPNGAKSAAERMYPNMSPSAGG